MKKLKLAVLPGDGIGQEVTETVLPIFETLNIPLEITFGDIGWEFWKKEGNSIPSRTWQLISSSDATLLGAITSKPEREAIKELAEEFQSSPPTYISPIIQLRQKLDLYANVRPCFNIKGETENFNFSIIRENTEGLYAGFDFYPLPEEIKGVINRNSHWRNIPNTDIGCTLRIQSRKNLTRLFEYAFAYADAKKFKRVTFADKPNVLRKSSAFARNIFESISEKYPHIEGDILNVDAVALWMIRRPQEFGVIVAENMFGDILSDLGAGIMGGLGFSPSANIGAKGCYFEPVHGSAPRIKPNCANPSAMFLTVALLLEHFGYYNESDRIKKAVGQVIKEGLHVTYDLGGNSSTAAMANAIIERCISPRDIKIVSFLSTGNEIIEGRVQDSNSHNFSKKIAEAGGNIYQHLQASDNKLEISAALKYLLSESDAVIVTGGLGPTSDDVTRFAIAEVLNIQLNFNQEAWKHVSNRLERFSLTVTESNKQQAMFPANAILYPNDFGTAYGCHIKWHNKDIFMLPGPPKECMPMFENHVAMSLKASDYFSERQKHKWLTLGLIEGEIAPKIDLISLNYCVKISYHWSYPYLEISISALNEKNFEKLIQEISKLIDFNTLSNDGKDAILILLDALNSFSEPITIIDDENSDTCIIGIVHPLLEIKRNELLDDSNKLTFKLKTSYLSKNNQQFSGTTTLSCEGYDKNFLKYQHSITFPNRGPEVVDFKKAYYAWQLEKFIKTLKGKQ